jgi:Tol biopolymer transport system component
VAGLLLGRGATPLQITYLGGIGTIQLKDVHFNVNIKLADNLNDIPISFNWSSDGDYAAFTLLNRGQYDLYLIYAAMRQKELLFSGLPFGTAPNWSPDSTAFTYISAEQNLCIYTLATAQIECANEMNAQSPVWSPDGTQIAFVKESNLYLMQIADFSTRQVAALQPQTYALAWSPDGKSIAYTADLMNTRHLFIYSLSEDQTDDIMEDAAGYVAGFEWSPDGTRIAYIMQHTVNFDLYVYDFLKNTTYNLTSNTAYEGTVAWSPDGKLLAYISDRNGFPSVYIQEAQQNTQPSFIDVAVSYAVVWRPLG